MLGASARYSRLHTPVETSAAPRRDKLRILRFRPEGENSLAPLSLLSPSTPPRLGFDGDPGGGEGHRAGGTGLCWDKLRILRFRPEGESTQKSTGAWLSGDWWDGPPAGGTRRGEVVLRNYRVSGSG